MNTYQTILETKHDHLKYTINVVLSNFSTQTQQRGPSLDPPNLHLTLGLQYIIPLSLGLNSSVLLPIFTMIQTIFTIVTTITIIPPLHNMSKALPPPFRKLKLQLSFFLWLGTIRSIILS